MYSRRDFGKLTLAGLTLSQALAKIDSKFGGVQIGVQSYSFRDRSLDDAIHAMVQDGIGECELFSPHIETQECPAPGWRAVGSQRSCSAGGAGRIAQVAAFGPDERDPGGAQEVR